MSAGQFRNLVTKRPSHYIIPSATAGDTEVSKRAAGQWIGFQKSFGSSSGLAEPIKVYPRLAAKPPADIDVKGVELPRFEDELAALPPRKRWKYLATHRTPQFSVMVLAAVAWVFAAVSAWSGTDAFDLPLFISGAHAQGAAVQAPVEAAPAFTTGDVFLMFLGMFIVWSLLTVTFAKTAEKIQLGSDAVKTLLGFLVGYFTSPKSS